MIKIKLNLFRLLITITLIIIFVVCIYLIFLNLEKLKKAERKEVENNEIVEDNKIAENNEINGWKSYKSPEDDDLEFQYPEEWGELLYGDRLLYGNSMGSRIYYLPQYQKIKGIWYHKPSNTLAFIERGEKYYVYSYGEIYREILKVIRPNKEIKIIVSSVEEGTKQGYFNGIAPVNFSPDGEYIYVSISGYDDSKSMIVNIENGLNITKDYDIVFDIYKNVVWSPDNKILAIKSGGGCGLRGYGGGGVEGVFVSEYGKPEKLINITAKITSSFTWEELYEECYDFAGLEFIDNDKLKFSLFSFENNSIKEFIAKYEYNIGTKELKKTF